MSCPLCGKATDAAIRPFCSKRCADLDLARWFNGSYAVPSEDPDDIEELEQMFQTKSEPGKPLLLSIVKFIMQDDGKDGDSVESSGSVRESQGSPSLRADASVTSLALDEYDHIEPVRKHR